jgi:hypothetical protein
MACGLVKGHAYSVNAVKKIRLGKSLISVLTRKAITEYMDKVTAVFRSYENGFNRYLDYINITKHKLRQTATLTKTTFKGPVKLPWRCRYRNTSPIE